MTASRSTPGQPAAENRTGRERSPWLGRRVGDLLLTAAVAVVAGVLTSYAQGWLPAGAAPLANSAGPWCAVAFLLAARARGTAVPIVCGALALVGLNVGYGLGSAIRGFTYSTGTALFWTAAAVLVGPVLGGCAVLLRRGPRGAGVASGVLAGLLVGEGLYGLAAISDTTPVGWWAAETGCGFVLLIGLAAVRLRRADAVAVAVTTAGLVAAALFWAYRIL